MNPTLRLVAFAAAFFVSQTCFAQNIPDAARLATPVSFDGLVNEPTWESIEPIKYIQQQPNFGLPPTERSEIFLAYDDRFLYLAGRMYLSDSSLYRGTTYKRDAFDATTDYFGFVIDSYNDNENALAFFTTPTAMRWDGTIFNDAQSDESMSTDWNTFWDAATARTAFGWSAEIRVPWSSLRFQDKNGETIMGITSWWYIAAKNEVDVFPAIPLNWGGMSGWKPSQAQDFRFRNLKSQTPLYLAPYLLAGFQTSHNLNEPATAWRADHDPTLEAGFDLKYSLTSNLTLDLTANTDFAQVEADDQQVNLTRFSLFFPEKRLFFQERASIFDFNFEESNRLFYSRRIGINDEGPVRILGGARLSGRIDKHDIGFLNMQTAKADSLNSENFTLARVRRQVFNQYSYLGFIGTNRTDFRGNTNATYGFDGIVRLFADEYLTAKWAQSFENKRSNDVFSLAPARIFLTWERRRYDGFSYIAAFSRAGKDWSPSMGFEQREDFSGGRVALQWGKLFPEKSKLLRTQTYFDVFGYADNASGDIQTGQAELGMDIETKRGWFVNPAIRFNQEFVDEAFDLTEQVEVPVGKYDFTQVAAEWRSPGTRYISWGGDLMAGGFYDGKLASLGISSFFKISPHFDFEPYYQISGGVFLDRDESFTAHLLRLKGQYMLSTKFSVAAFLQYNSQEEIFSGNVRLRLNPREGNDLFVVFNDVLNNRREREFPRLPLHDSNAVVVKYTYTFRF